MANAVAFAKLAKKKLSPPLDDDAPLTPAEKKKAEAILKAMNADSSRQGYVEVHEYDMESTLDPWAGPTLMYCGHHSWWWKEDHCDGCIRRVNAGRRARERGAILKAVHLTRMAIWLGQLDPAIAQSIARQMNKLMKESGLEGYYDEKIMEKQLRLDESR